MENWSLDLIFALPAELQRDWPRDLESCGRARAAPHLALRPHRRSRTRRSLAGATEEQSSKAVRTPTSTSTCSPTRRSERRATCTTRCRTLAERAGPPDKTAVTGRRVVRRSRSRGAWVRRRRTALERARIRGVARAYTCREDPIGGHEPLTDENRVAEEVYLGLQDDRRATRQPARAWYGSARGWTQGGRRRARRSSGSPRRAGCAWTRWRRLDAFRSR